MLQGKCHRRGNPHEEAPEVHISPADGRAQGCCLFSGKRCREHGLHPIAPLPEARREVRHSDVTGRL
eukprot:scaffold137742_cov205-Phaeocystis_antarctica.AAC.1